jgi:hypothetical protein
LLKEGKALRMRTFPSLTSQEQEEMDGMQAQINKLFGLMRTIDKRLNLNLKIDNQKRKGNGGAKKVEDTVTVAPKNLTTEERLQSIARRREIVAVIPMSKSQSKRMAAMPIKSSKSRGYMPLSYYDDVANDFGRIMINAFEKLGITTTHEASEICGYTRNCLPDHITGKKQLTGDHFWKAYNFLEPVLEMDANEFYQAMSR